jgi:hypothetical protein
VALRKAASASTPTGRNRPTPRTPLLEPFAAPTVEVSPLQSPSIGLADRRRMGSAGSRSGVSVRGGRPPESACATVRRRRALREGCHASALRPHGWTGVEAGPRTSRSGCRHGCVVVGVPLGCVPPPRWSPSRGRVSALLGRLAFRRTRPDPDILPALVVGGPGAERWARTLAVRRQKAPLAGSAGGADRSRSRGAGRPGQEGPACGAGWQTAGGALTGAERRR